MDRALLPPEAEWRMRIEQAAGAKHFPIGRSGATVAIYPYHHAERPHAGGGHWGMLLVNGFPFIVMTRHIFFTTPEKVGNPGPGIEFNHDHHKPQQIVKTPFEHNVLIATVRGYSELDYLVAWLADINYVKTLLNMDCHWDVAQKVKQEDLDEVARAVRAYVLSKAGRDSAVAHEAPPYWLNRIDGYPRDTALAAE